MYNGIAVNLSHTDVSLIHIHKTNKTENADYQSYVKAAALGALLYFLFILELVVQTAIPGMYCRNVFLVVIQFSSLPKQFSAPCFRIIHEITRFDFLIYSV